MLFDRAVEARCQQVPDLIAVRCGDEALTYAELLRRASAFAVYLSAYGVGPHSIVGVALPRTADLIVALLGILKSGAAYLPLDTTYPSARLRHYIEDARAARIVT